MAGTVIPLSLSSMPVEIIARIVHWVHQYDKAYSQRDVDLEYIRLRRKSQPFRECDSLPFFKIRRLALVNRTFYLLCCPYIYKGFDSKRYPMDTVIDWRFALKGILKRHSHHLRRIRCRIPESELKEARDLWEDELNDPAWDQRYKSRSEVLFKFLRTCPLLIDLDIDLDPTHHIPTIISQGSGTIDAPYLLDDPPSSDQNPMPNLSVQTISQLSSLRHLSLSSPLTQRYYTETFLVDIISNLSLLESFTCSRIRAMHPNPLNNQKDELGCRSPLGLHLASLTHLVELDLERAQCVDASWNKLSWKSSLKVLALEHCDRVSVPVLHQFLKLFESTLITLTLDDVPFHHGGTQNADLILQALSNNKFRFDFPKLTNLGISSPLPIQFLRAFQPSENISTISLDCTPKYEARDLQRLITDELWPNLEKFQITDDTGYLEPGDSNRLEHTCQEFGISMIFDDSRYDGDEVDLEEIGEWAEEHGIGSDEYDEIADSIGRYLRWQ